MLYNSFLFFPTFPLTALSSSAPFIHVEIPSFKTVMTSNNVQVTCLVHTDFNATITWLIDGKAMKERVDIEKNTTHINSNLRVPSIQWKKVKHVTCKAEHKCFTSAEKTINIAGKMILQQENQTSYDQRAI